MLINILRMLFHFLHFLHESLNAFGSAAEEEEEVSSG